MTPDAGAIITNIVGSYAFPVALVLLVGLFLDKRVWPFLVTIVERQQSTDAQRAKNEATMDERLISVIEKNTTAIVKNNESMNAIIEGQGQLRREFNTRMEVLEKGQRVLAHRFKEHEEKTSG